MTSTLDLPKTFDFLEHGRAAGLHLGGQLYVSRASAESRAVTDRAVADRAFGERAPGVAMTRDDLLPWMSSCKPVAAIAIGQLWERELLDLDDRIVEHIPEFGDHGKAVITLRHILTHTGGFRLLNVGFPKRSWDEIVAWICAARPEPRWTPGHKAGYHLSSSWFILGELVHRLDGRPFPRYVREEIFEPLGMEDSWIGMPAERFSAYGERIVPMWKTEKWDPSDGAPEALPWHGESWAVGCSPGGNGRGPLRELGRFYEALLARGVWKGHTLLRPQTLEALTTPHRVGMHDKTFRTKLDWGLGFITNSAHYLKAGPEDSSAPQPYGYGRHASRRTFGHSGYRSSTGFADPEHGLVVAVAVNGIPGEERHLERFHELVETIYEDLGLAARQPV